MTRPPIDGGVALVTGASSGIGRELVLAARRAERLEVLRDELESKHPNLVVHVAACDLAESEEMEAMLGWISERLGPWTCWSTTRVLGMLLREQPGYGRYFGLGSGPAVQADVERVGRAPWYERVRRAVGRAITVTASRV